MNQRLFSIALLISAFPLFASAGAAHISLNKGDFIAAERLTPNGETVINVKLSKSGKAKFKKLNENPAGESIHVEIAGVSSDFKLREPIRGDQLEMGPYSEAEAGAVAAAINKK